MSTFTVEIEKERIDSYNAITLSYVDIIGKITELQK